MPLLDTVGSTGTASPAQMLRLVPIEKMAGMTGLTFTVNVIGGAQGLEVGVNVYEPLALLLTVAGLQVPVIPLVEVTGNTGAGIPLHNIILVPKVKVGVITWFTVTFKVYV